MSERLHTLLLALAALGVLWLVFVPKPQFQADEFGRPLTTETRADGLAAAVRWLRAEGVPVESLRTRYRGLAHPSRPATGNVLVTHVPHRMPVRASERRPLDEWLRRGNTLVVMVTLNDTPAWSANSQLVESPVQALEELSGLEVEVVDAPPGPAGAAAEGAVEAAPSTPSNLRYDVPLRITMRPLLEHPLVAGVREVVAESDYPTSVWQAVRNDAVQLALADARLEAQRGQGLWLVPRGAGRVIVVGAGSPFTNRALGEADNALLFERLVVGSLGPGGVVLFDDAHQGASSLYTPSAFASDWRLYASVAILVALWLAWALGVQRLGVPPRAPGRPGEDVLVRGAAGHFARRGGTRGAARRMLAHFHARFGDARDGEAWARLHARRPEAGPQIEAARALEARVLAGKNVDVRRLRRTLLELERIAG